ncbi:MAG: hypothetical protein Unbinned5179contig1004_11 [Prokaryotic dsDNA virus sp.]|nr:MAG: hypothetical protein Unbinned5179contig1004_11 [Prokaryotic dsDNA virus sp.]|tara:strand:- start:8190 stop:8447 length:258 start_codon:yes stop_codon:yes gene_type:complete
MKFYALIQKGYTVLDIGQTEQEALEYSIYRAKSEEGELFYSDSYAGANDGDLVLVQCTEDLYNAAKDDGDVLYDVSSNVADIYRD